MVTKRIIPCLDVRDGRVVKGVNFQGLRDVSDPVALAEHYSRSGADELVFYDITASHEGRKLFTDILTKVASAIFIPLTVGAASGGWTTSSGYWPAGRTRFRSTPGLSGTPLSSGRRPGGTATSAWCCRWT